jgi:peroxiredoxin
VLVYCVNDSAVMKAWSTAQGCDGSMLTLLGDPGSKFTEALGLVLDHPGPVSVLGGPRCKRFSMLIDDGSIKTINIAATEDDPAGDDRPDISLVEKMLMDL